MNDLMQEVFISNRFKDKEGNLLKFKIKPLNKLNYIGYKKELTKIINQVKLGKKLNAHDLVMKLIIDHTIDPDFRDQESMQKTGCSTPEEYLNKSLLLGEICTLAEKILNASQGGKSNE